MKNIARLFLVLSICVTLIAVITFVPVISGVVVKDYEHVAPISVSAVIMGYIVLVVGFWGVSLALYDIEAQKKRGSKRNRNSDPWQSMVFSRPAKKTRR